jgi:hypothetical protein
MTDNNNPSDETNQEPTTETHNEAPAPPVTHGWLEQFKELGVEALNELKAVAAHGLTEFEADALVFLSVELIQLALKHDPAAFDKVKAQIL